MGKYNIGQKYDGSYNLTISSLCHELMDEYEDSTNEVPKEESTYRHKMENSRKNGLIDKLKEDLNFDIKAIAEQSSIEKFDMLKILKLLYYIEKDGSPKYKSNFEKNIKVQIIDILKKPKLENVPTIYSPKSQYGKIFSYMYNEIKSEVSDADEREKALENINLRWECLTECLYGYVISDWALQNPEVAIRELNRLYNFLNNDILKKLSGFNPSKLPNNEGNMKTFFNILACHKLLCNEADRIEINYQVCMYDPPSEEYIEETKKYEHMFAKKEIIPMIKQELEGRIKDPNAENALYFITYGKEICDKEITNYKYALGKVELLTKWIEKYRSGDFSEGIAIGALASIVQEICFVRETKASIKNDYYGYKNTYSSLTAALKRPDKADAITIQAWVKKLENRVAVNYGAIEMIKKKREVENIIYKIKEFIYSYHHMDDLVFVNEVLFHFVYHSMARVDLTDQKLNEFFNKVRSRLKGKAINMEFHLQTGFKRIFSMFKAFILNDDESEDEIASGLAMEINEIYENSALNGMIPSEYIICYGEKYFFDYILTFKIDKENDKFLGEYFNRMLSDEKIERLKKLGLEKFITK